MSDDRGVSITVNYVLGLSITFILASGLLLAGGQFVEDQREQAVRTQLEVLGEQIASDVSLADRLNQTTRGTETVRVERTLPPRAGGSGYSVRITDGSDPAVVVEATDVDVNVTVDFKNSSTIQSTTIASGSYVVRLSSSGPLVLEAK